MSATDKLFETKKTLWELKNVMANKLREPRYVRLLEGGRDEHTANLAMMWLMLSTIGDKFIELENRILELEKKL